MAANIIKRQTDYSHYVSPDGKTPRNKILPKNQNWTVYSELDQPQFLGNRGDGEKCSMA